MTEDSLIYVIKNNLYLAENTANTVCVQNIIFYTAFII